VSRRAGLAQGFAGWALLCGLVLARPAAAADVGGFLADQQKAREAAAAQAAEDSCPQWIARAARDDTALAAYRAGLCYLQADVPDVVAAKAWLARSAELDFMPAQRLLRQLLIAEAGPHGGGRHCHSLGDGRQLCHGGAPPLAAATP
jgi:hypothetical protein